MVLDFSIKNQDDIKVALLKIKSFEIFAIFTFYIFYCFLNNQLITSIFFKINVQKSL